MQARQPSWFLRAVLATAFGGAIMAATASAQEAHPLPIGPSDHAVLVPQPVPPPGPPPAASGDVVLPPWRVAVPESGPPHPVLKGIRNYFIVNVPLFCRAHHNGLGCGNFVSEFNFAFGSCRSFYGEPCLKGPPPQPMTLEAFYSGAGHAPAQAGCRCP